jgi:3-methyl-2-oxobutanoate hydroxymethyltransferase
MTEPAVEVKRKKVTIPMLMEKKKKKEPIVQLAVYDYENAIVADRMGIDILCVSDTGGMVLFGHESTTSVSFEEVMYMAQAVQRGSKYGLRMVDMPVHELSLVRSASGRQCGAVRLKSQRGSHEMRRQSAPRQIRRSDCQGGHPVQGHIGICPMRIPQLGGFAAQGKTADRAKEMIDDAMAFVDAGCFSILTEVVTSEVSQYLAETLPVPVISLGSGNTSDGVTSSARTSSTSTKNIRRATSKLYVDLVPLLEKGYREYMDDVKNRRYPGKEHTVFMKKTSWPSSSRWSAGKLDRRQRCGAARREPLVRKSKPRAVVRRRVSRLSRASSAANRVDGRVRRLAIGGQHTTTGSRAARAHRRRHRRPRQAAHAAPDCGDVHELQRHAARARDRADARERRHAFAGSSEVHLHASAQTLAAAIWAVRTHVGRAVRDGWREGPVGVGSPTDFAPGTRRTVFATLGRLRGPDCCRGTKAQSSSLDRCRGTKAQSSAAQIAAVERRHNLHDADPQ